MADTGILYSAAQAERVLNIPAEAIRQWAHRGRLQPAGSYWRTDPDTAMPLYSFADLMALDHERRTRNGSRSTAAA